MIFTAETEAAVQVEKSWAGLKSCASFKRIVWMYCQILLNNLKISLQD